MAAQEKSEMAAKRRGAGQSAERIGQRVSYSRPGFRHLAGCACPSGAAGRSERAATARAPPWPV